MRVIMAKDATYKDIGQVIMLVENKDCRPFVVRDDETVTVCVPSVDDEVRRDPQRQTVQADHVLNHLVGPCQAQSRRVAQGRRLVRGEFCPPGDLFNPLFQRLVVKSSQAGRLNYRFLV